MSGWLDQDTARIIGVKRQAHDIQIAELALRAVGYPVTASQLSPPAARWIRGLVDVLAERRSDRTLDATTATAEVMVDLSSFTAPAVLAVLAPDQAIPASTTAAQLGAVCRMLVRRHLPTLCERLIGLLAAGEWFDPADSTFDAGEDRAGDRYDEMARRHDGHD